MEVILCDTKIVVRQQNSIATSTAPVVILRHIITVLVFWQLDSDSVTILHLRAIQDKMLIRMTYVPKHTTETPEAHMIRWSKLQHNCRRKHKILHGDEMYFASYFSWCGPVARLTKADPKRETSRIFTLRIWNGCGI